VIDPGEGANIVEPIITDGVGLQTSSFRFSPDGSRLAVLFNIERGEDINPLVRQPRGMVLIVDADTGKTLSHVLTRARRFWLYRFCEDSNRLVTNGSTPVTVWDAETGKVLERPLASWGWRTMSGGGADGRPTVEWNEGVDATEREKLLRELAAQKLLALPFCHTSSGYPYVVTNDFSRMIVVWPDAHSVWNARTGEKHRWVSGEGGTSVAASADGKQFAIGRPDGHINLYDVESGEKQASFSLGEVYVSSVAFSPDGTLLAAGCSSLTLNRNRRPKPKRGTGEVRVLDAATGEQRASFGTGVRDLPHVRFSPDGKVLAAEDGFVSLGFWNVETWEKMKSVIPWPEERSGSE
jgi:WD40 repeat protein